MSLRGVRVRVGRWLRTLGSTLGSLAELAADVITRQPDVEVHTLVTFRAVVDAVIPQTPALGTELGPDHVPGGLAIDLDEFVVTYVDNGFQLGLPHVGPHGNLPFADPIAHALDNAALTLVDRRENTAPLSDRRPRELLDPGDATRRQVDRAAGPFSKLSRRDRLRAIAILDEFQFKFTPGDDGLFEFDAGLVGQLVVGFTELIYYSEWAGYDDYSQPPSKRRHSDDPAAVQSWRQTGYPGPANGYSALRGYLGTRDGSLGGGDPWTTVDPEDGVEISHDPGSFRENDYDTSDYTEPFPE